MMEKQRYLMQLKYKQEQRRNSDLITAMKKMIFTFKPEEFNYNEMDNVENELERLMKTMDLKIKKLD